MRRPFKANPEVLKSPALRSMLQDESVLSAIVAQNPGGREVIQEMKDYLAVLDSGLLPYHI